MNFVIIKCVGKNIYLNEESIKIHNKLGKDQIINIGDLKSIKYELGTLSKNGFIKIVHDNNGMLKQQSIMFRCTQNDKVECNMNSLIESITSGGAFKLVDAEDNSLISSIVNNKEEKEMIKQNKLEEKERKRKEFERIMNSSPEVTKQPVQPIQPIQEKQVCCPKCGSTQLTANKKGFGLAKGAVGVLTFGAYGVIAAGMGKNKIIITCLSCGKQFKPGK